MFFKDTADFRKYFSLAADFAFSELEIHLRDVDRTVLKRYLGAGFLKELQDAFDANLLAKPEPTEAEKKMIEVLELIRRSTPYFCMAKWVPGGQLNIDAAGLSISVSENRKMPWEWQVRNFIANLNNSGTAALDDLLQYLEENITGFETYKGSAEFKSNRELFVGSSAIFEKHYSGISASRVTFYRLKSIIRKVEDFDVKGVLLPDYYAELKAALKTGDALSDTNTAAMELIQPAVVNLTIARAIHELSANISDDGFLQFDNTRKGDTIDTKAKADGQALLRMATMAENDGRAYLKQLHDLLQDAVKYPTYAADSEQEAEPGFEDQNTDDTVNFFNL